MYTVFLEQLEFYGYHGVSEEERSIGHRFVASAHLKVNGRADESDLIEDTVDYGAIAECILGVCQNGSCHTVERLAHRAAAALLDRFPSAIEAEVSLSKLNPPVPAVVAEAGVIVALQKK